MKNLINVRSENGNSVVSARELYLGLGLAKAVWSRWYPTNIENNDFFKENIDWVRVQHNVEGNETMDFAITLDFAKHIAMMAKTKKSHIYRNYFIECEKKVNQIPALSKELQAIFAIDQRTLEIDSRVSDLENNMPLFNVECKELQALVRKVATRVLGGYRSPAYCNNSLRGKVYSDIQNQLKREFGVERYEAIKRSQLGQAKEILSTYKAPLILVQEIQLENRQIAI